MTRPETNSAATSTTSIPPRRISPEDKWVGEAALYQYHPRQNALAQPELLGYQPTNPSIQKTKYSGRGASKNQPLSIK
jgi:hypothetical protein